MTLMSFIKFIEERYDRDMHIKTLVHVVIEKKICDIEKHFEVMTLQFNLTEYVKYETTVDFRNEMKNVSEV
jgi:hypothetical protein